MELEVRHLRLVQAIALDQSVTKAGHRLHLTQSALSHQLRDLEGRLGTPVFHRLSRKMAPTPAGERLLEAARAILDRLRTTEEEIRRLATDCEGVLRIAVECYTCYHWLPGLLATFRRTHPRVEVRICAEETRRPAEALLEGRLDLALLSSPVRDRRLAARTLFHDEFVVIMHPGHPLARRPYVRPEDFADQHLYIYSRPEENTALQRVLIPAGVLPRQITQVQLTEAIFELVKAGHGIAVVASWSVAPFVRRGALRARTFTRTGLTRRWQAVRLRARPVPRYAADFEDLLAGTPPAALRPAGARRTSRPGA